MALSGSYSFSVVRDDIIREALLNVGALGEAEVPTAQEVTDCARKLNMMVKQWMGTQDFAPGLKMWTRQRGVLFLSSTQHKYLVGPIIGSASNQTNWAGGLATSNTGALYGQQQLSANANAAATTLSFGVGKVGNFTAGDKVIVQVSTGDIYTTTVSSINSGAGTITIPSPGLSTSAGSGAYVWNYTTQAERPLQVVTCFLRDINFNDTPIDTMTLQEYEALPSKAQPGNQSDPIKIYYESQFASGTSIAGPGWLYIDCYGAQDVTKQLHITYLRAVMDLVNPGDNPEYPQQWYRALCWGLAQEIAPMFDADFDTASQQNYREAVAMAREADSETTVMYFQANPDAA